ncbi:MAG: acyclic terpene utilization AtuA family protein [Planctomycetota bacterium]
MPKRNQVSIANGQGFWGDSILGPVRLVREGPLDYLTLDYLAEVTMSILQKQRARDPKAGYATDFVRMIGRVLPEVVAKNIKIVANAGGVNPIACKDAVLEVMAKAGVRGVKVAVVEGDDIFARLDELAAEGEQLANMDTGAPLSSVRERVSSANVYLGAFPIAEALGLGAQIVITGRGTDPGLVLGPMIHEFGWKPTDYDLLAAGTIAGHIVECGVQCTGGNLTDWRSVSNLALAGYPIIEMRANGEFAITKHPGTGGLVNKNTLLHQLVYEMGDPHKYIGPDNCADFDSIALDDKGGDRVEVRGAKGSPPTETYKVSISYQDGWKATGQLTICGPDALEKARLCAEIVWKRLEFDGCAFSEDEKLVEFVGANVCHAGFAVPHANEPSEVVLRLGVKGRDKQKIERFTYELVPLVTSGPPGVTGFAGGRPQVQEIVAFWPALMRKDKVRTRVQVFNS